MDSAFIKNFGPRRRLVGPPKANGRPPKMPTAADLIRLPKPVQSVPLKKAPMAPLAPLKGL